jgi:hypothetical protein
MNSYYMDFNVTSEQRRDRLQAAHEKQILQQAGVTERGWLRAIMNRVGHLLVGAGQRLMRYEATSVSATAMAPRMAGAPQGR